jgi:aspartate aminotransferase/aminotransferase
MAQKAALAALACDMTAARDAYRRKRDLVYEGLKDLFELTKPRGAFYAFPRAPGDDASSFVTKAIEHKLLIIPGSVFSERDTHFRISYAAPDETIARGMDVLRRLVRG